MKKLVAILALLFALAATAANAQDSLLAPRPRGPYDVTPLHGPGTSLLAPTPNRQTLSGEWAPRSRSYDSNRSLLGPSLSGPYDSPKLLDTRPMTINPYEPNRQTLGGTWVPRKR